MDFSLTDEQIAIRDLVREFAQKEVAPLAQEMDAREEFPEALVRRMGELGLMGLPFPEEYGGSGADTLGYILAIEEMARVDSSLAITLEANVSLGGVPLLLFGTEEQKQRWLVPLAQGQILGSFGLTEPGAGSDAGGTATAAALVDDGWVINGAKCFITNAGTPLSGFVTITAVTGQRQGRKEISNILVPRGTPGYTQGSPYRKMGWHASDTRELSFVDCRLPVGNLIGERGRGYRQFLTVLDGGRVAIAALAVGLAQGALDMSLQYARQRRQFGQPIAQFQATQFKLADMATQIDAARLLTYRAAALKDAGQPFRKEAAMAKLFASELAVRAAEEGVQIHGGYGFMDEYAVSRFYRDAKVLTIGEGTSEICRLVIARRLLEEEG